MLLSELGPVPTPTPPPPPTLQSVTEVWTCYALNMPHVFSYQQGTVLFKPSPFLGGTDTSCTPPSPFWVLPIHSKLHRHKSHLKAVAVSARAP